MPFQVQITVLFFYSLHIYFAFLHLRLLFANKDLLTYLLTYLQLKKMKLMQRDSTDADTIVESLSKLYPARPVLYISFISCHPFFSRHPLFH
jgi:hypothetical protein